MATDGRYDLLTKKEVIKLERERKHLQANLAGIKNMKRLPDALFIVDSNNEAIAVKEARKLGIPVVAVVDTNCDPTVVDYVIPGNDDALRAIRLFTSKISDSVDRRRADVHRQGVCRCHRWRHRTAGAEAHVGEEGDQSCRAETLEAGADDTAASPKRSIWKQPGRRYPQGSCRCYRG